MKPSVYAHMKVNIFDLKIFPLWYYSILFLDTDLQCDFNSPYWEDLECAWSFKPSALSIPLRKMEWVKAADSTAGNYWITDSATTGIYKNYVSHCLCFTYIDFMRYLNINDSL